MATSFSLDYVFAKMSAESFSFVGGKSQQQQQQQPPQLVTWIEHQVFDAVRYSSVRLWMDFSHSD